MAVSQYLQRFCSFWRAPVRLDEHAKSPINMRGWSAFLRQKKQPNENRQKSRHLPPHIPTLPPAAVRLPAQSLTKSLAQSPRNGCKTVCNFDENRGKIWTFAAQGVLKNMQNGNPVFTSHKRFYVNSHGRKRRRSRNGAETLHFMQTIR